MVGGHIYEALFGVAALVGVFWMAWTAYRPLAAPLAAALLAVSPGFLLYAPRRGSRDADAGRSASLAVAAAQAYYLSRRRSMAALAGLFLFAGTEIKLLSVVVAAPARHVPAGRRLARLQEGRPRALSVGDAAAFVLCLGVPALLVLLLLSPGDQWRQVVTFHLAASRVLPFDPQANVAALRTFLGYDPGLLLVAVAGGLAGILLGRRRYVTPGLRPVVPHDARFPVAIPPAATAPIRPAAPAAGAPRRGASSASSQ